MAMSYNEYVLLTPLSLQAKTGAYVLLANLSPCRDDSVSEGVWCGILQSYPKFLRPLREDIDYD